MEEASLMIMFIFVFSQALLVVLVLALQQIFGGVKRGKLPVPRRRFGSAVVGHTMELFAGELIAEDLVCEQRYVMFEWIVLVASLPTKGVEEEWPWTGAGKKLLERPDKKSRKVSSFGMSKSDDVARRVIDAAFTKDSVDLWRLVRTYALEALCVAFDQNSRSLDTFEKFVQGLDSVMPWPSAKRAKKRLRMDSVVLFEIASRYNALVSALAVLALDLSSAANHRTIDEALRLNPPVIGKFYTATESLEMGGCGIPKGTKLYCDLRQGPYFSEKDTLSLAMLKSFQKQLLLAKKKRHKSIKIRRDDDDPLPVKYPTLRPLSKLLADLVSSS